MPVVSQVECSVGFGMNVVSTKRNHSGDGEESLQLGGDYVKFSEAWEC